MLHYVFFISLCLFFFLMIRRPPRYTRTDTLFPYTTLFRSAKFTSQLTSAPTPTSVPYTAPMHHRSPLQSPQHEFPSGASDAGVYQLSRQHAAVVRRQQQPHLVELRALGLVHGHGEGAVVLRERSEERRVGKERVSTCRSRGSPYH